MLQVLVQLLDALFMLIETLKITNDRVANLQESANASTDPRWKEDNLRVSRETQLEINETYTCAVNNIHKYCFAPTGLVVILRILNLLLGALWQQRVVHFLEVCVVCSMISNLGSMIFKGGQPNVPVIMTAAQVIIPWTRSKTLFGLATTYICSDTVVFPVMLYLENDISDRVEVRLVLIGILLDVVYFISARALSSTDRILLVLVIAALLFGLSVVLLMLVYNDGWWNHHFMIAPGRDVQRRISRLIESGFRYVIQQSVFKLNDILLCFLELLRHFERTETSTSSRFSSTIPYKYSELASKSHIRLLKLQPGRSSQDIICQFVEISSREMEYDAISYVWGDASLSQSVLIDRCFLTITKSAYDVLQRYRSPWKERLLWIDQICINQKNEQEKSAQVQMMKNIYQNATKVVAFLGPATDSHLVQSHFAELHFRYHALGYSFGSLKHLYNRESKSAAWHALGRFFGNPYFRRVWILQEVVFAKQMYIFYGDNCFDWKYVSRALEVLGDREMLEAFLPSDGKVFGQARIETMKGFVNINAMLMFRGEIGNKKKQYSLAKVLVACLGFQSTDPRDKVYAILGLAPGNTKKEIIPNYSSGNSSCQLYTKTMRYLLTRRINPLHCLNLAGTGHNRLVKNIPSWVPDWSLNEHHQPLDGGHSAASNYDAVISFDRHDENILYLDGETIDNILYLGEIKRPEPSWNMRELNNFNEKWLLHTEVLAHKYASNPYLITGAEAQPVLEAFIRTMISNKCSYVGETPTTTQCFADYEAVKDFFNSPYTILAASVTLIPEALREPILHMLPFLNIKDYKEMASKAARFLHFSSSTWTRRFCITKTGRMATVPPNCKEGDNICLIKGAKMPYVLRKKTLSDRNVHELVGNCYVHGVMNGEVPIQNPETFVIV